MFAACGGGDSSPTASPTSAEPATPTRTPANAPITHSITVFAASSLTEVFTQMKADIEAFVPGLGVNLNFGGSQQLRTQLEQGAEADLFASADTNQMSLAAGSGIVTGQQYAFAHNKLVIIVPKSNEANISKAEDLARSGLKIVIAGEEVPVGVYTRKFLEAASADPAFGAGYEEAVLNNVVSEASNVKEVASSVQLGEADAGIVYATDARALSDDVTVIDIPDSVNQTADYTIALTYTAINDLDAQSFIDYLLDPDAGQGTLESFGFIKAY